MAASPSDLRAAFVRGLLLPVLDSLDRAEQFLAMRQFENGALSDWECFGLTMCRAIREHAEAAIEDGDANEQWNLRNMLRFADDAAFAVRWTPEEWWHYVARTRIGRDTLEFVRDVENEVALGYMSGAGIDVGFIQALRAGEALMEAWELEQTVPACVGAVVRVSI